LILDNLDIYILLRLNREALDKGMVSTGEIAQGFYDCEGEECEEHYKGNKNRFMTAKTNLVKRRLQSFEEEDLVAIDKDERKNSFKLNEKKVIFEKKKLPDGKIKKCVCILGNVEGIGKWMIFEI